ncbi:hypothetical protein [Lactococcus lactis]|uniref:HTH-type transcriptional regulator Rgg C-terminal domain-containing protein n=1 Tax=Lactococcus lactis TaxID=1358 RepID=A0AAP4DV42_9LACT|nr:hypothetical protein [Lactococcus lactis]MDG4969831.1 hypothetical protein [Lactococcus lactis]MDG4977613.1 hypothetical protein [Lactococcus lactis]MDG5103639.1 hypothetical protein [Lactococcus lactis]
MLALEMIHLEILAIFSLHFTLKQAGKETLQHNQLECAELHQNNVKLQKLYKEAVEIPNFFLALIVKSKITRLTKIDTQRIVEYLQYIKYWGYFELSLLQAVLSTMSQDDIEKIFSRFEARIDSYRGVFKYTRKIYQISYQVNMIRTAKGAKEFAEKIFKKTASAGFTDFDFFILSFRNLVIGFMKYRFENVEQGLIEITDALSIIKILGGDKIYTYYQSQIDFYISQSDKNIL